MKKEKSYLSFKFFSSKKNIFVLFCFSVLISVFVFYFMSILISSGTNLHDNKEGDVSINFLLNESLDDLELRSRRRPEKPKDSKTPPEIPKLKIKQTEIQKPDMSSELPELDLPDDFQSDQTGAGVSDMGSKNKSATPVFRVNPIYPRRAAMQNIEGFVLLQFDITKTGETDNISILEANPLQIFNSSAIQALKKWKYKPKLENGKPIAQYDLKVRLDFSLVDD
ncbi:MAG: energy transducer TonB [Bdellovibrionales bacterium]|nr:energy transducer TonB [Bdellovibrionales bacterium]